MNRLPLARSTQTARTRTPVAPASRDGPFPQTELIGRLVTAPVDRALGESSILVRLRHMRPSSVGMRVFADHPEVDPKPGGSGGLGVKEALGLAGCVAITVDLTLRTSPGSGRRS